MMSKEKIYFDTNCIAYLRSPEDYSGNEDINEFNTIFNKTFFNNVLTYCSTAHFMDLFNANEKFLKKDLDFLDNLSNHNFLFFDKLYNSINLISPIHINDAFIAHEDYKKHPEKLLYFSSDNILLNNFFIKTITESSKILNELNSFDIIKETEINKILPFTSIIEAIISDKPLPQIPKEKINLYKEIRKIFIQYINKYKLGN